MARYLLDTNVCIRLLRGHQAVQTRLAAVGPENCCISEITVAELLFGAEKSSRPVHHRQQVAGFVASTTVIPIAGAIPEFARQKAQLQRAGTPIDDFDLLIGCTAARGMVLVTHNTRHFERVNGLLEQFRSQCTW